MTVDVRDLTKLVLLRIYREWNSCFRCSSKGMEGGLLSKSLYLVLCAEEGKRQTGKSH